MVLEQFAEHLVDSDLAGAKNRWHVPARSDSYHRRSDFGSSAVSCADQARWKIQATPRVSPDAGKYPYKTARLPFDHLNERRAGREESPCRRPGRRADHRTRNIRVLPSVFGLTRSRSRNSATPSSYERSSSA